MRFRDIVNESPESCPHCGGPMFSEMVMMEKKDACYYKVKASAKVWPSAYASGRLVQCRKKGAANYGNKSESVEEGGGAQQAAIAIAKRESGKYSKQDGHRLKEAEKSCPPATQNITLNLKNRQKAIDEYGYGPLNPDMPNRKFWMAKQEEWNLDSPDEAKQSLCGNCAAFDQRKDTLACIAQGIGSDAGENDPTIEAGDLGYCRFLKFKCAARRTCDAWVTGGPLTDEQGVAEGSDDNGISFQVQKGKNKFATTLSVGVNPVGVYQYDADTGRSVAEVYPEFKGKGLGKLLVLHAIYTAAKLGLDFQEDESRTSEYDNVLDSLSSNGYIVDDDGYWYVTGEGEQYLQHSLKQGVAEEWSQKYKSSINCSHPKGFSQKAHCAGKKKHNESVEMEATCPDCGMCESHANLNEEQQMTHSQDELSRILELGTGLSLEARAELHEEFDLIESIIDTIAEHNGVDAEVVWADLESLTEDELYVFAVTSQPIMESEAWQKANNRDRTDGMSRKAVNTYRREHPGSKLQTAVTTKPSKLKKGSKASKRRKSYCSRSRGQMKMHNISCSKTPDKAICKARRRWNC
jgi:GNAT superfamily N-acetyltransferase